MNKQSVYRVMVVCIRTVYRQSQYTDSLYTGHYSAVKLGFSKPTVQSTRVTVQTWK